MSGRAAERRRHRGRRAFLGIIERGDPIGRAPAAGATLEKQENVSGPTGLRRGRLGSITFWLFLLLVSDWTGQSALSQEIVKPEELLRTEPPPLPPAKPAPSVDYGKPLPSYGTPPTYRLPAITRPEGKLAPAGQTKFDPADLPVLTRPRPELDPLGMRLGSFLLFPGLKISEFYDDNIQFSESHTQDDFITEIAPSLALVSDWEHDFFSLEAGAAIGRYAQHTNQNYEDYGTSLKSRFWATDTSYLDQEFSYNRRHSNRDSPDDANGVHPTEYDDILSNLGYFQEFGRFTLRLDGTFRRLNYLNDKQEVGGVTVPIDNSDRDRNNFTGTGRVGYLIRQDIETYIQASYGVIRYDTSPDDNGFDRNADTYDAIVGLAKDWNGIFQSDVYVGYMAQTFVDSSFDTIDGVDFGGKLTWNVTRRTTLTATVDRSIAVSTLDNASGSIVTEAGFSVDHELRRDLLLYMNSAWRQNDFSGIDRTDENYEIGVGANYFIMRNFVVGAGYSFRQRNSNVADADYSRNLIMLNLDLRF
jgi:hypothetical protein